MWRNVRIRHEVIFIFINICKYIVQVVIYREMQIFLYVSKNSLVLSNCRQNAVLFFHDLKSDHYRVEVANKLRNKNKKLRKPIEKFLVKMVKTCSAIRCVQCTIRQPVIRIYWFQTCFTWIELHNTLRTNVAGNAAYINYFVNVD